MIKKILLISPVLFLAAAMDIASNAAPASSTGAPGENDCTTSGCHTTYVANSGPGSVKILPESFDGYEPGKTYTISVEASQNAITRFGFQLVALANRDQANTGAFVILDGSSNQVIPGYGNLADRKYMTYTFKSTNASATPGTKIWTFMWTAPAENVGPITFYAAAIAGDNDGTDSGDQCYTSSRKISSPAYGPIDLNVFPNPAKNKIELKYTLKSESDVQLDLFDAQGKWMETLFSAKQTEGAQNLVVPFTNWYRGGVYFLKLNTGEEVMYKKILINDDGQ
jgi:hypothetical protein